MLVVLAVAVVAAAPARAAALRTSGWQWTAQSIAPGVTVKVGVLAAASAPFWTVTIDAPATSSLTGQPTVAELGTQQWAQDTAVRLRAAGYLPRVDVVDWPSFTDTPQGVEGFRVRTGVYGSQADALAAVGTLKAAGFTTAAAEWTGYDADQAPDAEQVHVAIIDPSRFHGEIEATHDGAVAQREKTSAIAAKLGALVAVNGGFFVTSDADGYQGVSSGLAVYGGTLESQSVGARAALVLGRRGGRIDNLVSTVTLRAGRAAHAVEGVNRKPGLARDCGRPGLQPTSRPRQDFTCTSTDELVLFTPEFGAALPTGPGAQVALDAHGTVIAAGPRGGAVAAGAQVVQGIGTSASWLTAHAPVDTRPTLAQQIRDAASGARVDAEGIVSAAPVLLRDGQLAIDADTEGVLDAHDLSFGYAWAEQRQPRTMAGIDGHGRLLLVTVDGRQPGTSEGVTIQEGGRLMRELGAVDAMNLDGGGSSAMAVNGLLVNHPSDATGERAIGDAVVVRP
ncbi:MAG TPA: phosphodiester glycosidase family protein [Jatrophihabitantaceae bacterium]